MKTKRAGLSIASLLVIMGGATLLGQGGLQNSGFEAPVTPLEPIYPPGFPPFVLTTSALPAWAAFLGTSQQSYVLYNAGTIGSSAVVLFDAGFPYASVLQGSYSVLLIGGVDPGGVQGNPDASISQSSLVPVSALSIRFRGRQGAGDFAVSLGGQNIPVVPLVADPNYTVYGGDISAFAGQIAELRFTAIADFSRWGLNQFYLDAIAFSDQRIPEPSSFGLLCFGILLLGCWLCRKLTLKDSFNSRSRV